MKNPLVTVLLPVYNNESINLCIDSVLKQTFTDYELLIIDNASTDNTINVIKGYDDARIKLVVNKENIGPTGSLNKGVSLAKGKYIARIDADDLMLPERLEKQVDFMENNPDYGIVGSWTKHIDESDNLSQTNKLCVSDKAIRAYMMIQSPFYHPAVMMRSEVLKDNELNYDLSIKVAVEYKLWNEILKYSKGSNLPEVLTYYRVSSNSLSHANAKTRVKEYLNVRKYICEEHREELVLKSLQIEEKQNKNLLDCFKIFNLLTNYLNKKLSMDDQDYASLKSCIYSRIYQACGLENEGMTGKLVKNVLKLYKR